MSDNTLPVNLGDKNLGAATPGPIARLTPDERATLLAMVLARAVQDERLADIAADLGVAKSTLHAALLTECEQEWRDVQAARALTALENAEEQLEAARDSLDVARARELVKAAQWRLERLHRRLFGTEHAQSSGAPVVVNIGFLRDSSPKDVTP